MNAHIYVKPNAGCKVRHPNGIVLPEAGSLVIDDSYWQRRISDGDVLVDSSGKNAAAKADDDASTAETPPAKKG